MNDVLTKTESKVDRVIIDLTLKFSKEIQLNLFKDVNQTFHRLKNIEGEMIEIAHTEMLNEQRAKEGYKKGDEYN